MDKNKVFSGLDPGCMLRELLRQWWMILLAALIAVGGTRAVLTELWKPTYTSSATYAVTSRSGVTTTATNRIAANEAAVMLSGILESEVVTNQFVEKLGSEAAQGTVKATVVGETNMLVISASAPSARLAFEIMQVVTASVDDYFLHIDDAAVLQKMSGSRAPLHPDKVLNMRLYLEIAALLGAGLMLLLLLWIHIRRDTLQTVNGARDKLDAQILVSMPHEKSAPLVGNDDVSFYFRENLYRLRSRIETARDKESNEAVVILVTSVAANEGKSTIAANLALALAEKHNGVLLMDLDLRNPSQKAILGKGYAREHGLDDLILKGSLSAEEIMQTVGFRKDTNLMVMQTHKPLQQATDLISRPKMKRLMAALRKAVQYIVLDVPPIGFFPDSSVLSDLADLSVLVVRQDVVSACDINDAADTLRQGKSELLGVILNDMRNSVGIGYGYGYGHGYGYGYGNDGTRNKKKTAGESNHG